MTKEKLIEKLKKIYELGGSHEYLKMTGDIYSSSEADLVIEEMAENIIAQFKV